MLNESLDVPNAAWQGKICASEAKSKVYESEEEEEEDDIQPMTKRYTARINPCAKKPDLSAQKMSKGNQRTTQAADQNPEEQTTTKINMPPTAIIPSINFGSPPSQMTISI